MEQKSTNQQQRKYDAGFTSAGLKMVYSDEAVDLQRQMSRQLRPIEFDHQELLSLVELNLLIPITIQIEEDL